MSDYSQIPIPDFAFGNSQEIHNSLISGLITDTTDPVNSHFALAGYNGTQNILSQFSFTNGVHAPNDPTADTHLCKRRWVRNNFVHLTDDEVITGNKQFSLVNITGDLNITNASNGLTLNAPIFANGATVNPAEVARLDGVSSNIQNQLDSKQATITGSSNITLNNLTVNGTSIYTGAETHNGAVTTWNNLNSKGITNCDGYLNCNNNVYVNGSVIANAQTITAAQLGYVSGATSNLQTQIQNRVDLASNQTITGQKTFSKQALFTDTLVRPAIYYTSNAVYDTDILIQNDVKSWIGSNGVVPLQYINGLTSDAQTQINSKINSADAVTIGTNQVITGVKTIDNLITATQTQGDNSTKVATTAYCDIAVANLVGSSPSNLNTLSELANSLASDSNFSTTMTNALASKANDNAVVHNTGAETIGGVKSFTATPLFQNGLEISALKNITLGGGAGIVSNLTTISDVQMSYLSTLSSNVQNQINSKQNTLTTGSITDDLLASTFVKPSTAPILTGTNFSGIPDGALVSTFVKPSTEPILTGTNFTGIPQSGIINLSTDLSSKTTLSAVQANNNAWSGTNTFNTSLPTSTLTPSLSTELTTKAYVDSVSSGGVTTSSNNAWTGTNTFNTSLPTSTVTPTTSSQLVTKTYVDTAVIPANGSITDAMLASTFVKPSVDFTSGSITLGTNKTISGISSTIMGYLTNLSADVQSQINGKQATLGNASITDAMLVSSFVKPSVDFTSGSITLDTAKTICGVSATTMSYLDATSSIQTQLNGKQATLGNASITDAMLVSSFVKTSGAETIAGIKTFSSAPVMSGASISANTIPDSALVTTNFVKTSTAPTLTGTNFSGIPQSAVTSLVSDLAGKFTMPAGSGSGNYIYYNGSSWVGSTDGKVRLGTTCGSSSQGTGAICIGTLCGNHATNPAGADAIFIGRNVGWNFASACPSNCIAIGNDPLTNVPSGQYCIAIGSAAGYQQMGGNSIALGNQTLRNGGSKTNVIAIGQNAMYNGANNGAISIGYNSMQNTTTGLASIAIGQETNNLGNIGDYSVAIGFQAGNSTQGSSAIAIGNQAGKSGQVANAIAIGQYAGQTSQTGNGYAIGTYAGNTGQGVSIAYGYGAGQTNQANNGCAIGHFCSQTNAGAGVVSLGYNCANSGAGTYCVCIGTNAGATNAPASSIIINATNGNLNPSTASAFYVNPVRNDTSTGNPICFYNTTTKEISYKSTLATSAIASGALTITTLASTDITCSSVNSSGAITGTALTSTSLTNSGGLSTASIRKIINSIGNNGTANNFTLDFSSGTEFCLTTNIPSANFTVKLINVGTDTAKSIKFTVVTNTGYYCNSITAYTDNSVTQITLSSGVPLFEGTPSVGSATVVRQTFTIIRSFASNYVLSDVVGYA